MAELGATVVERAETLLCNFTARPWLPLAEETYTWSDAVIGTACVPSTVVTTIVGRGPIIDGAVSHDGQGLGVSDDAGREDASRVADKSIPPERERVEVPDKALCSAKSSLDAFDLEATEKFKDDAADSTEPGFQGRGSGIASSPTEAPPNRSLDPPASKAMQLMNDARLTKAMEVMAPPPGVLVTSGSRKRICPSEGAPEKVMEAAAPPPGVFVTSGSRKRVCPSEAALKKSPKIFSDEDSKREKMRSPVQAGVQDRGVVTTNAAGETATADDSRQKTASLQSRDHSLGVGDAPSRGSALRKRGAYRLASRTAFKAPLVATSTSPVPTIYRGAACGGAMSRVAGAAAATAPVTKHRSWVGLPPQLDTPALTARGVCAATVRVTSTNAADVIFSSETGMPCDIADCKGDVLSAATAAACLVAAGKRPRLLTERCVGLEGDKSTCGGGESPAVWRAWVRNHYRWVVWKLAAASRQFGVPRLTFENVVCELKARFECEIERASKPFLKAVLQRDTSEASLAVLVVSRLAVGASELAGGKLNGGDGIQLELSDGWYCVWCEVDALLTNRVTTGAISVGTKLAVEGARLINTTSAVDPLSILLGDRSPETPVLRIEANGVRRARASARLGAVPSSRMILPLRSISPGGGVVPLLDAIVTRVCVSDAKPDGDSRRRMDIAHLIPIRSAVVFLASRSRVPGEPISTAELELSDAEALHVNHVHEGDLVRVSRVTAVAPRHGTGLVLRFTRRGTLISHRSPAPRSILAASAYRPRRLVDGAALVDLGVVAVGARIDYAGIITTIYDSAADYVILELVDASPHVVSVAVERDGNNDFTSSLQRGVAITVLHAILLEVKIGVNGAAHVPCLTCDDLAALCISHRALENATPPGATRTRLKVDFDALLLWARTPDAQDAHAHALLSQASRRHQPDAEPSKSSAHDAKVCLVAALLIKLQQNSGGTMHADLLDGTVCAPDLNAALEAMQTDGIIYVAGGKYFPM